MSTSRIETRLEMLKNPSLLCTVMVYQFLNWVFKSLFHIFRVVLS